MSEDQEFKTIDRRQIAREEPRALQTATPAVLLEIALKQGADIEKLTQLMALQERWEANEARKAYALAMAAFKAEDLTILKNKRVKFTSQKGTTDYKHATLDNVVHVVGAALAKHGLMHTWKTDQANGKIRVTCIITHENGHREETTLECAADDSGNKNSIQAIGSAVSYLQRYTLVAATGVATGEDEDDGAATSVACITESQAADLGTLLHDLGKSEPAFCNFFKIDSLKAMPVKRHKEASDLIQGWLKKHNEKVAK